MHQRVIDGLYRDLAAKASMGVLRREPLRVWRLSGVERLHLADGSTAIFKYAAEPFTGEDRALRLADENGVPVPELHTSDVQEHTLGMIMEDRGPETRDATDTDGAQAAARLHTVPPLPDLATLDQTRLAGLVDRSLTRLTTLTAAGRWTSVEDLASMLTALSTASNRLSTGAELAPFGLCHSEFHPTSLHISETGWRLLDFARAFNGPGLLDLASWHGTNDDPDPAKLRHLLGAYVAAGGHRDTLATRGGLLAENWALGWHRIWAIAWYLDQSVRWINDPESDPAYIDATRRHLREAVQLLAV
ncbi:hypothetical protein Lfu02_00930 [Longispora fulva]|uniref:Aminoglycoside phosphotransferase n=1 Tax=Longispora fulva TaxID=619741 RepID=A0A8J7KW26_9ACTN|nr:phosphotransferase [Longispora fulva]MBG6136037.1 hypothetical protein [Longispora fulva]GIG55721.1 hypothetical protein Lfu02_00930 [Longispora fulva]